MWHHAIQTASLQRGEWDLVECVIATHSTPYDNAQLSKISNLVSINVDEKTQTHSIDLGTTPEDVIFTRLSDPSARLETQYPPGVNKLT